MGAQVATLTRDQHFPAAIGLGMSGTGSTTRFNAINRHHCLGKSLDFSKKQIWLSALNENWHSAALAVYETITCSCFHTGDTSTACRIKIRDRRCCEVKYVTQPQTDTTGMLTASGPSFQ